MFNIYDRKFLIQIDDVHIMLSYKYLTLFQIYIKKLKIMFYKMFLQLICIYLLSVLTLSHPTNERKCLVPLCQSWGEDGSLRDLLGAVACETATL